MELSTIQNKIYEIRGYRVMLDFDLAEMYGTETKVLKQTVRRNIERFPSDFMFELTKDEYHSLRSQIVTLENEGKGKYSKYLPFAFTQEGVAMLSGILRTPVAIQVNIGIMRAFVAIRQLLITPPANEAKELQSEMRKLKEYIEEVLSDYNDMHEDTRMQIDLINETLAELQAKDKLINKPRKPVGYIKPKELDD